MYRLRAIPAVIVPREKFIHWKFKPFKNITRILRLAVRTTAAGAFLDRHADVICRHQQLNIPFQTDNGKLPQRYIQFSDAVIQNDIITKHAAQ